MARADSANMNRGSERSSSDSRSSDVIPSDLLDVSETPEELLLEQKKAYCEQLPRFRFENFDKLEDWVKNLYYQEYRKYRAHISFACEAYLNHPGAEPDVIIQPDLALIDLKKKAFYDPDQAKSLFFGNRG
jgi:hypothetical protein